jgi:hypothetical protein
MAAHVVVLFDGPEPSDTCDLHGKRVTDYSYTSLLK